VVVYEKEYCILREDIVRERRECYSGTAIGYIPSFCWIIIKEQLEISLVDIAYIG
jgi:hypothetical protein